MALLNSVEKPAESKIFLYNVTGGLTAGTRFFFPTAQIQRTLTPNYAIGFSPTYGRSSFGPDTVSALGLMLTGSYYGSEYYRGLWIQASTGVYFFSHSVDDPNLPNGGPAQSATSFAFAATAGWRGYWDFGLNVGVGAGFQFIADPNFTGVDLHFTGVQPLLLVDIGFNF
jgi:hypothetical protein